MKIENPFKHPEDKLLFAKALDKYTAAQKKQIATYSDFLDPARCAMFVQTFERMYSDILITTYGGYENAERKIVKFEISISKPLQSEHFPIAPIAITYNERFSKAPTHRDYLGAVLGLGLDRGKIGDIRLAKTGAILYVSDDIVHFIAENLCQVGRVAIKAKAYQELEDINQASAIKRITVPSLRVDAVISSAFNLSRGKVANLIESEKVFVNWKIAKRTYIITVGDAITVRGMGRITIDSQGGNTKKDRIVLEVVTTKQ